jgi:hypothetical protein
MARPKSKALGGFATFRDHETLDRFLDDLKRAHPALLAHARRSETRPTVVFRELSQEKLVTLREALADRGQFHEDIQFHPA